MVDDDAVLLGPHLLVVDDVGYLPLASEAAAELLQVLSRRYMKGSIIRTTNRGIAQMGPDSQVGISASNPGDFRRTPLGRCRSALKADDGGSVIGELRNVDQPPGYRRVGMVSARGGGVGASWSSPAGGRDKARPWPLPVPCGRAIAAPCSSVGRPGSCCCHRRLGSDLEAATGPEGWPRRNRPFRPARTLRPNSLRCGESDHPCGDKVPPPVTRPRASNR